MACVHDGYLLLRATVEHCATVCPSEPAAEVCHKKLGAAIALTLRRALDTCEFKTFPKRRSLGVPLGKLCWLCFLRCSAAKQSSSFCLAVGSY